MFRSGGNSNFSDDAYDVLGSWLERKDAVPKGWNGETSAIVSMPYGDAERLGRNGCLDLVARARLTMLRFKSLSNIFVELASAIQTEYEATRSNFDVVSNMCGLVSLPTELLDRILKFTVNADTTSSLRSKAAVRLSHVCQYLRRVALSCPQIWANISRSTEMTSLCLSRSKDVPLDVDLTVTFAGNPSSSHFDRVLCEALSRSRRWKSLNIRVVDVSRHGGEETLAMLRGHEIKEAFRNVDAPLLEALQILNHGYTCLKRDTFAGWNTPNLRRLTTAGYFPHFLPGLEGLTSLDLTLSPYGLKFSELISDLSRMAVLEDFAFRLKGSTRDFDPPPTIPQFARVELPSIRKLRIETVITFKHGFSKFKSDIFGTLYFPGALDLHIRVRGRVISYHYDHPSYGETNVNFDEELNCILRDWEQFANVDRFYLEVYGQRERFQSFVNDNEANSIIIPFDMFPKLKSFTLRSNRPAWAASRPPKRSFGGANVPPGRCYHTPPTLQTVTVRCPVQSSRNILHFVANHLLAQKERGGWDEFLELVMVHDEDEPKAAATKADAGKVEDDTARDSDTDSGSDEDEGVEEVVREPRRRKVTKRYGPQEITEFFERKMPRRRRVQKEG